MMCEHGTIAALKLERGRCDSSIYLA